MPLTKDDAPTKAKTASDKETDEAVEDVLDAGAGAPAAQREAAEALPEKDDVQKHIKKAMLAEDAQTEAKEKAAVVDLSPNADETPSGFALKKVAGISDDVKRGEEYARQKSAVRWGYVHPSLEEDK